jgi:hypothetical protein
MEVEAEAAAVDDGVAAEGKDEDDASAWEHLRAWNNHC